MDIKRQYNEIGRDYIEGQHSFFNEREDWGRKMMLTFIGELDECSLVDVGCGDGTDVLEYQKRGAKKIIGVDPSSYMINEALHKKVEDVKFLLGDYEKIPVPNESADIVTGRYSMHYLDNFELAYKEISRVLKVGGMFVTLLPHPSGDFFMEKEVDDHGKEIVCVPLYNEKVTVRYPVHSFEHYFSDKFFKYFSLEGFREFIQGEVQPGMLVPTAMVIKAVKK